MSNEFYTPSYLTAAREDPFERRQRERREEEAKREKEAAKREKQQAQLMARQEAQQQQRAAEWSAWFEGEYLQRADPLHDAIAQFVAEQYVKLRDESTLKIVALEDKVEQLENKLENALALNKRFNELEREHAARQAAFNEAKRGAPGKNGARGKRGERGARGEKGDKGEPGIVPTIVSTKIDEHYNLVVLRAGGLLEIIPLREAFERYHAEVTG